MIYKKSKIFCVFENFLLGFTAVDLGIPDSLRFINSSLRTSGILILSNFDSSLSKSAVSISD